MNPRAISAAQAEIARARRAILLLEKPKNFSEAASAWFEFLLAANRIYSKLERGAKGNGRSMAWFGRMKHARKNDELLSYLHHARNAEEHGLEQSIQIGAPRLKWLKDDASHVVAPERRGNDIVLRMDQGKGRDAFGI
jgi:hypothetical protein